jgi:hypothetical protein
MLVLAYIAVGGAVVIMDYIISAVEPGPMDEIPWSRSILNPRNFVHEVIALPLYKIYPEIFGEWRIGSLFGVFVWSTLMGIGWLAVFSVSVIIANISLKLHGVGPWLSKNFQVQRQPFRILAALVTAPIVAACVIYHVLV